MSSEDRPATGNPAIRRDLQIIADMISHGSRVLDVGCGDGALLDFLVHRKRLSAGRFRITAGLV